jgi:hypothetical protein
MRTDSWIERYDIPILCTADERDRTKERRTVTRWYS